MRSREWAHETVCYGINTVNIGSSVLEMRRSQSFERLNALMSE
jgi:hypothetical protein